MYFVVRTYANAGVLADKMAEIQQEITDRISGVPGFVAYCATRADDNLTTVTVCDSQAGTQESTRRAGELIKQHLPGASIGAPRVAEGETFVQF